MSRIQAACQGIRRVPSGGIGECRTSKLNSRSTIGISYLARLNALVRRSAGFISPRVKAGDYELDLSRKELTIAGEVTVLTSFEYLILEYLMRNARQVVSKQQLLDQLYGDGEGDPNTIEVMVSRLRKKLDPEGAISPISTIRRQGYIFNLSCS